MQSKIILTLAYNTFLGFVRERVFYGVLAIATGIVLFSLMVAEFTFVDTQKILLDFGLASASLCGIVISILIGLSSISREIEKKIIYTVIGKPLSRFDYILGKYLGCGALVVLINLVFCLLLPILFQFLGEGNLPKQFFASFGLMTLESLLMLSLAQMFSLSTSSTYLAGSLTLAVFAVGRSDNAILSVLNLPSTGGTLKIALKIFYDIFPSLGRFNIRDMVAYNREASASFFLTGGLYFLAYTLFLLCLSAILFRKKDLN